uniref:Serine protease 36 n=1 Tax=Macaca mulatta TaxID=9544 RepID=A0A5F7ZGM3_MACMU
MGSWGLGSWGLWPFCSILDYSGRGQERKGQKPPAVWPPKHVSQVAVMQSPVSGPGRSASPMKASMCVVVLSCLRSGCCQLLTASPASTARNPMRSGWEPTSWTPTLRTPSPVTFSRYIRPICLPAANASFPNGLHCTVTGWGHVAPSVSLPAPKPLQQLEVPLISRETCNCLYNIDAKPEEPHFVQEDMVCAGYVEGGKDACQGDSGGPLSCPVEGLWYLTGIVSWGDACGARNRPGVYTLASSYASWIQSKATELQPRVVPQTQESQPDSNLCSSHLAFNSAPAQGLLRPILSLPLGLALGLLSPWLSEH